MITNQDLLKQYTIFSSNIRHYRKLRRLTQEQLAEQAELSTSYIKQIESGKEYKNISLTTMLSLSKVLDVPITELFKVGL